MPDIHVDLLSRAKTQIQSGKSTHICAAIAAEGLAADSALSAACQLLRYVQNSIDGYGYACKWLHTKINPCLSYPDWVQNNRQAIQDWRCRWIDQIIDIFKGVK